MFSLIISISITKLDKPKRSNYLRELNGHGFNVQSIMKSIISYSYTGE
jgi:hypothetical protein